MELDRLTATWTISEKTPCRVAELKGEKYYQGKPCKDPTHHGVRYTSCHICVECASVYAEKRKPKLSERAKAKLLLAFDPVI